LNVDPSVNLVVFEVRRGLKLDKHVGEGRTRDPHCISAVWSSLQRELGLKTGKVRRVYSEWQPSPEDAAFLKGQFPADLEVTYSFERPADHQWDTAFAQARQTMLQARGADAAGGQRLLAGIPDPDTLLLCAADSPVAREIQRTTLGSRYTGAVNLTPCLLLVDHGMLSVTAKRP
jgi:hypothetical protein